MTEHRKPLMKRLQAEFPITDAEATALHLRNEERLIAWRAEILRDALTAQDLAVKFHRPEQVFIDRYNAGQMLAVRDGDRLCFPTWQLEPARFNLVADGLAPALSALVRGDLTDLAKAIWFILPNTQLGGASPKDVLRQGNANAVRRAANTAGDQS